ncbi:MAG TPA: hypothetical protein VE111_14905 [Bradyrhizobium sp.]|nr:hypothetical protein [Bradyrhizobium sp.]
MLALPDAFNPAAKHPSARLGDDRIMIRPHSMLSIFVLLQSHIDFLCGYEARPYACRTIGGDKIRKRKPAFSWGGPSRAVPLNLTLCVFFKLSGARLSGIVAWW